MENNNSKIIAIIALVIGVLGLTIGFAAFAQTLTISNTQAEVRPENSLNVHFPTSGTVSPTSTGVTGATGSDMTLTGTQITGLKANFQEPGQSITYETTITNDSTYVAYLNGVTFSKNGSATCAALGTANTAGDNPATIDLTTLCGNMKMYLTVGTLLTDITTNQTDLSGKTIAAGASVPVTIKLAYEGNVIPDGNFTTDFGDIVFSFNSVD